MNENRICERSCDFSVDDGTGSSNVQRTKTCSINAHSINNLRRNLA